MTPDEIELLYDFEGAMIDPDHKITNNNLYLKIKKENVTRGFREYFNYNLHFNFGLKNNTLKKIGINIHIECGAYDRLLEEYKNLWVSNDPSVEYDLIGISGEMGYPGKYRFSIEIGPNSVLYLANFPPIYYNRITEVFNRVSDNKDIKTKKIGKTIEGRSINAYEYGDLKNNPVFLFVSGFHPPERDTYAIESIMRALNRSENKKEILENYSFSFIPILNPDGFANYLQGSNIKGINFHWKFFGNSIEECPESHAIWDYCKRIKPVLFMDFHSFTFQNHAPRPYVIPQKVHYFRKSEKIQNEVNSLLIDICHGEYSISDKIFAPNLLSTTLQKELGTVISPKFHIHMKEGFEEVERKSVDILFGLVDIFQKNGIHSRNDFLVYPYGKNRIPKYTKIRRNLVIYYYLTMRPFLGRIKNRLNK